MKMVNFRYLRLRFLLSGFMFLSIPLLGHETGLRLIQHYSPDDFDGGSKCWAVTQDYAGVLYVGNLAGVLEFDGEWWHTYHLPNQSAVRALTALPDGSIAVGGSNEIGLLIADTYGRRIYSSLMDHLNPEDLTFGDIYSILPFKEGFWALSTTRLFYFDGSTLQVIITFPSKDSPSSLFVWKGRPHLFLKGKVMKLGEGVVETIPDLNLTVVPGSPILEASPGVLWFNHPDRGILRLERGQISSIHPDSADYLRGVYMTGGCVLHDGRIVITTGDRGAMILNANGEIDEVLSYETGLMSENVMSAFPSRDGDLWLSLQNGLARIDIHSPMTIIDNRLGLNGPVSALLRHRGKLFIGTSSGLFILHDGKGSTIHASDSHVVKASRIDGITDEVWGIQDVEDQLIIATSRGVYRYDSGTVQRIPGTEALTVYALHQLQDQPDSILLGLRDGVALLHLTGTRWKLVFRTQTFSSMVHTIAEAPTGILWLGTILDGACRISYSENDPIREDKFEPDTLNHFGKGEIGCFRFGNDILMTAEDGILKFEGGKLILHPGLKKLGNLSDVFYLAEDASGTLWMNTHPPSRARLLPDHQWKWESPWMSALPGKDIQIIYPDRDDVIWFSTDRALTRFDSTIQPYHQEENQPLIRRASVGPTAVEIFRADGSAPILSFPVRRLRIEYTSACYYPGVRYQCRIDPGDDDWSSWSSEPFREYTNLWEGEYAFRVRSMGLDGNPGPEGIYRFTVLPPWYRTLGAYILWFFAAALSVFGIVRWRNHRLRKRAETLENQVMEQTRSLAQAVDELRSAKEELEEKNTQLEEANTRLHSLSFLDGLTGIPNRRHLEETLHREWSLAWRSRSSLAFVLMDIDHFKLLNDSQGHQKGDDCLQTGSSFSQEQPPPFHGCSRTIRRGGIRADPTRHNPGRC